MSAKQSINPRPSIFAINTSLSARNPPGSKPAQCGTFRFPGGCHCFRSAGTAAAIAYVNATPRSYTLAIDRDVYSGPTPNLAANNANLLIYGHGEPREIRFTSIAPANNQRLFDVGSTAGVANPMLTLGNRITLVGRTQGQHGQTANNAVDLVSVAGLYSRLIMQAGSRITGHTTTAGNGAVVVDRSNFITRGEITGNRSTSTDTNAVGGVRLFNTSTIRMEVGSRIDGNTRGLLANPIPADISMPATTRAFELAGGNIMIGTLIMDATAGNNPVITIDNTTGWSGRIANLDLRQTQTAIATVVDTWTGNTVVRSRTQSMVLGTLADIGSIQRRFVGTANTVQQPFATGNHRLALEEGDDGYWIGVVRN